MTGVEPPPSLYRVIGTALSIERQESERLVTLTNTELTVPAGYVASRAWVSGVLAVYTTDPTFEPNPFMSFEVGRASVSLPGTAAMNSEDGAIAVAGQGYAVTEFAATIEVLCTRTPEAFAAWQLKTFNSIIGAYNDLESQHRDALNRLEMNLQAGAGIAGRNPDTNRDIERRELKRQCISLLTNQHFDDFDSMRRGVPPYGYPQMNIADATAEGEYIRFIEQAFEWGNIAYRFYPYFWGRKSEWPAYLRQDDTDPLFAQFLQAGAARVQIPVQLAYKEAVMYFLQGHKPWEEDVTAFTIEGSLYASMVDEVTNEERGAFTKGDGTIAVQQGSTLVGGTGTAFDPKLHLDREIIIDQRTYRVTDIASATQLTLDRPYAGHTDSGVSYSFGGRLVGDPWEVRIPTTLVMLQDGDALPEFTDA